MKKIIKRWMALAVAFCCALTPLPEMHADTVTAVSGGTSFETAAALAANTAVTGTVSDTNSACYYKYTVTTTGYFTVGLTVDSSSDSVLNKACNITIYDDASVPNELETTNGTLIDTPVTGTYTSRLYNYKVGRTVYIKLENVGQKVSATVSGSSITLYDPSCSYSLKITTTEASDWEQESNDTYTEATDISDNAWILGSSYIAGDVDVYSYTIPANGYFTYEFQALSEDATWDISLYNESLESLDSQTYVKTRTSDKYVLPVGSKVYVTVTSSYADARYKLRANYYASDAWEKESNDTLDTATTLSADKTLHGTAADKSDMDFYCYTVTKKGWFQFQFANVTAAEANWNLVVYDADGKKLLSEKTDEDLKVTLPTLAFRKGTVIYLKVSGANAASYGLEYTVSVSETANSSWEQEYNNTFKTANKLTNKKKCKANSYARGDKDYFVYKAVKKGKITLKVTLPDSEEGYWRVCVYDSNKKLVAEEDYVQDSQKFTVKAKKKGQKYYVVVQARDSRAAGQTYSVTAKQK